MRIIFKIPQQRRQLKFSGCIKNTAKFEGMVAFGFEKKKFFTSFTIVLPRMLTRTNSEKNLNSENVYRFVSLAPFFFVLTISTEIQSTTSYRCHTVSTYILPSPI